MYDCAISRARYACYRDSVTGATRDAFPTMKFNVALSLPFALLSLSLSPYPSLPSPSPSPLYPSLSLSLSPHPFDVHDVRRSFSRDEPVRSREDSPNRDRLPSFSVRDSDRNAYGPRHLAKTLESWMPPLYSLRVYCPFERIERTRRTTCDTLSKTNLQFHLLLIGFLSCRHLFALFYTIYNLLIINLQFK